MIIFSFVLYSFLVFLLWQWEKLHNLKLNLISVRLCLVNSIAAVFTDISDWFQKNMHCFRIRYSLSLLFVLLRFATCNTGTSKKALGAYLSNQIANWNISVFYLFFFRFFYFVCFAVWKRENKHIISYSRSLMFCFV